MNSATLFSTVFKGAFNARWLVTKQNCPSLVQPLWHASALCYEQALRMKACWFAHSNSHGKTEFTVEPLLTSYPSGSGIKISLPPLKNLPILRQLVTEELKKLPVTEERKQQAATNWAVWKQHLTMIHAWTCPRDPSRYFFPFVMVLWRTVNLFRTAVWVIHLKPRCCSLGLYILLVSPESPERLVVGCLMSFSVDPLHMMWLMRYF